MKQDERVEAIHERYLSFLFDANIGDARESIEDTELCSGGIFTYMHVISQSGRHGPILGCAEDLERCDLLSNLQAILAFVSSSRGSKSIASTCPSRRYRM
jgi:hypothetical protein